MIYLKADVNGQCNNYNGRSFKFQMAEPVRLLVDHGADVTALDMTDSTSLHVASSSGDLEVVRILVESGADVNAQNETHLTPLHMASLEGGAETVQLLIEHGADVTSHDWNHRTPLHFASSLVSAETYYCDSCYGLKLMSKDRMSTASRDTETISRRLMLFDY